jgi:hypothetical protein
MTAGTSGSIGSDPELLITQEETNRLLKLQVQKAENEAKSAKCFAILALIVSAMSLVPDWYEFIFDNTNSQATFQLYKSIEALEKSQTIQQSSTIESLKHIEDKFDSLSTILDLRLHHQ